MEYIKILKIADVREVLDKLGREEITYSKMVELLNIKINEQLAIYGVVVPKGTLCECSWPLIRTGTSKKAEYCGNCGKDLN